jgi:hypothetical protein
MGMFGSKATVRKSNSRRIVDVHSRQTKRGASIFHPHEAASASARLKKSGAKGRRRYS